MKIHFIGIGGIGVSALAQYYLATGHQVTGSDLVPSDITNLLERKGAKIIIGVHRAKNLPCDVDKVVYSPAVKPDNPELKKAKSLFYATEQRTKIKSYPEALGELTKKHFTIAVCGTHGKSTTTAMLGLILIKAGLDPTVIVGTKLKEFGNSNFRMGKSKYLVIEACEYKESFLNYSAQIIVITNIEKEHLDYFKNLDNVLRAFRKFVKRLPKNGGLIVNGDDENIQRMLNPKSKSQTSGQIQNLDVKIKKFLIKQKEAGELKDILKVPGEHNVYNALAALTAARVLKVLDEVSFRALSEFKGCWRRFEIVEADMGEYQRRKTQKITIISDYAHHPTEVKATLQAGREKFLRKKIWCVFQPHQYQRTYYFFDDFIKVFSKAVKKNWVDKLIITDIYEVAGRENKVLKKKVSSKKLINEIKKQFNNLPIAQYNNTILYIPTIKKIINYLKKNLKGGEVVFIMGAGDIYDLTQRIMHNLFNKKGCHKEK